MKGRIIQNEWLETVKHLQDENARLLHDEGLDLLVRLCMYFLLAVMIYARVNPLFIYVVIACRAAFDIIRRG